jgi:outer membrane beta-barrel protein
MTAGNAVRVTRGALIATALSCAMAVTTPGVVFGDANPAAPKADDDRTRELDRVEDRAAPSTAAGENAGELSAADADACIDQNVKADLFAKRKRRDVRERLFQQTNRHELTVQGGYYASDLFDGTYVLGGAYAYHMTEDLAVEASAAWTRIASSGGPELERAFSLLGDKNRRSLLFDADLVWDPAHGKLRLGGAIQHFDLYAAAGAGVVDSVLSNDIAGNAALGLKFFIGRAIAVRIDFRDHVYRQQLLVRKEWVNDVTAMIGLGVFLPVRE